MISKNLAYFFVFPDMFCTFAPMETKNKNNNLYDKDIVDGLLNHDNKVEEMFYEYCEKTIKSIIYKYYDKRRNEDSLFYELAHEFFIYIRNNPKILQDFKGKCRLKGYLASVAFHYFSSYKFDMDPAIKESIKERRKVEEKNDKLIRKIDGESENYHAYKSTPIPTEFRDEEESADAFITFNVDDDEDDKDIIVDIDEIINTSSEDVYTDKCQLVRQTLEQMPPKQAELLKLQYLKGIKDNMELAKELGITINTLYNLRNRATESFITRFNQLKKQQNEAN